MDNVRWYKEEKTKFKCSPNIKQKVSWGWSTSLVADCLLDQKSLLGQLFKDNALKLPYSTNSYIDIYDSVTRWVPVFVVDEVTRSWLDISDFVCRNLQRWRRWTSTRKTISQVTINYQFHSVTQSCLTPCDPLDCSTSGLPVHPNSQSLLKRMSIESVMPSNHLILCRLFLLPPSVFHTIRVFSSESALRIRWPKYWSFSFNISPSNDYSGQISFGMDWYDLLADQGTLKSLLQHHSSKASIL